MSGGDLSFTDIHCHLLPGIDDGPRSWEGTLAMARLAVAEGIATVVATPHQLGRYEPNTAQCIRELVAEGQRRLGEAGIPLTLLPGADVRIREDLPDLVRRGEVLTLADHNSYILLELPHEHCLPLGKLIYQLHCQGVACILSHPERNRALSHNPELLRSWVHQGCLVQITARSITGDFGKEAQKASRWLLKQGLVHLVATDAHDTEHRPPLLRPAFTIVSQLVGASVANRLFVTNPRAVIQGGAVEAPLPTSPPQQGMAGWWAAAVSAWRG